MEGAYQPQERLSGEQDSYHKYSLGRVYRMAI